MEADQQTAWLMERVVDPTTREYKHLMEMLLRPMSGTESGVAKMKEGPSWNFRFPFRGDPSVEAALRDEIDYAFPDRAVHRDGLASLAYTIVDLVDLLVLATGKKKLSKTVCITEEADALAKVLESGNVGSGLVTFASVQDFPEVVMKEKPETLIVDHTTVTIPISNLLTFACWMGVRVVDGVFPYHAAAVKGWDVRTNFTNWSYTHSGGYVSIGPDDDPSRMRTYTTAQYGQFVDPSSWTGAARQYGYELRKQLRGLVTYRAVHLGNGAVSTGYVGEPLSYQLPVTSSPDVVLVTLNRRFAAGVYASKSNNARDITAQNRDYSIEVRKDLFFKCVDYLVSLDKGSDIAGAAVRYISQHNYIDLMDGVHIVRCSSLAYADALGVAMVCSLTAFQLRYKLTNESIPDIVRTQDAASLRADRFAGSLVRLIWLVSKYVSDPVRESYKRTFDRAVRLLRSTDYIPGVCFDVYTSMEYRPQYDWFEPANLDLEDAAGPTGTGTDAFTGFMGEEQKTAAPSVLVQPRVSNPDVPVTSRYNAQPCPDPIATLQHCYDVALPGNSVAGVQNVAEMRRTNDINVNAEFVGSLQVNKDVAAPERLLDDAPLRTTALPSSRTPLVDALLAAAKRNFNPPDIQMQNDPWSYARYLVDKFVDVAFIPGYSRTIEAAYRKAPLKFNVCDYLEWKATRDQNYRSALEAECPEEMVELELQRYDTIIKKRVKPKLSSAAQFELAQPQVIVSLSKKDTALFTSLFRKVFERFDSALRPEFKSAGRMSDQQISDWFTEHGAVVRSSAAIEIDSSKYDKSQGLLARMIEALLMERLGLDPEVNEIFSQSYVGRVSSKSLGLMFMSAYQMKSGAPQTMLGNLIYNMVSAVECVGADNIALMLAKGDDNLVWPRRPVDGEAVVSRMSSLFNLECKLIRGLPPYFSSGYVVEASDRLWFVPDPLKLVEILGETLADDKQLAEVHTSFMDRVSSMTAAHDLPERLQHVVRLRVGVPDLPVVLMVDALSALSNFEVFKKVKVVTGSF